MRNEPHLTEKERTMFRYLCYLCDEIFCSNLTINQLPTVDGEIVCSCCHKEIIQNTLDFLS